MSNFPLPLARSYVATMLHRGQDTCLAKILGVYQVRWCRWPAACMLLVLHAGCLCSPNRGW